MSCASVPAYLSDGERLEAEGHFDAALTAYERAVARNAADPHARAAVLRARTRAAGLRLALGDDALAHGRFDEAETLYRAADALDPLRNVAAGRLDRLLTEREAWRLAGDAGTDLDAGDGDAARRKLDQAWRHGPRAETTRRLLRELAARASEVPGPEAASPDPLARPVTLDAVNQPLGWVLHLLARRTEVDIVVDRDVRADTRVNVTLRDVALGDALLSLLAAQQLAMHRVSPRTVLVYPDTAAKHKTYRPKVTRVLSPVHVPAVEAAAALKGLIRAEDVAVDERTNRVVVSDTAESVALAERILHAVDQPPGEVELELDVVTVARGRLQNLGVQWAPGVSLGAGGTAASAPIDAPARFTVRSPALVAEFRATVTAADVLARPRLRVKHLEKAKFHVGDKVPTFSATVSAGGFATSVSYLDVGIKVDVEPAVLRSDEVALKLAIETSNVVEAATVGAGTGETQAYRISSRTTSAVVQLRDGETQILAGLTDSSLRRSSDRVPGLGDFPLLGRLFGTNRTDADRSEVVFLVTPRIVRTPGRVDGAPAALRAGTDARAGASPLRIGPTGARALRIGPGGADEGAVSFLSLSAPGEAAPGTQFAVLVGIEAAAGVRTGSIELAYDAAVLTPVNLPASGTGRVRLAAADALQGGVVIFSVIGAPESVSPVEITDVQLLDAAGRTVFVDRLPGASVSIIGPRPPESR